MRKWLICGVILAAAVLIGSRSQGQRYLSGIIWPEPAVVNPGADGKPPADAIVLFDGKSFDAWKGAEKWKADDDGGFTVKGVVSTKQSFGDCQLHLEFATPKKVTSKGQGRGNNGIGLMGGKYEIQVLDSYNNKTYPEGQCASVYNQRPPMVNVSRKPGEWQTYDILFTAPRFEDGKIRQPAYVTILHNGVVVQNHTEILGSTHFDRPNTYSPHPEKLPIVLMYHGNPVRFRNIWIREFQELQGKPGGKKGLEGK